MLYHGAFEQALMNVRTNLACLSRPEAEAIIVDCPTCQNGLREELPAILDRFNQQDSRILEVVSKVTDIGSFIFRNLDVFRACIDPEAGHDPVTYHAPCHLRNKGTTSEQLLQALHDFIDFRPAADAAQCCGGGGTFFYAYPELAGKMAESKCRNARATGAQLWLTDCPVCRMNLSARLESDDSLCVLHPAGYLQQFISKEQLHGLFVNNVNLNS